MLEVSIESLNGEKTWAKTLLRQVEAEWREASVELPKGTHRLLFTAQLRLRNDALGIDNVTMTTGSCPTQSK